MIARRAWTIAALGLLLAVPLAARADEREWDLRKLAVSAQASSMETNYDVLQAFDGDLYTRWSSKWEDNQWISLDLGAPRRITAINPYWEKACASEYRLEVSDDGTFWNELRTVGSCKEGEATFRFDDLTARYVRLVGVRRATAWGFSLRELTVLGPAEGPEPEYGGLIRPHPMVTVFDHDWENLSRRFAEQCAQDPTNSAGLSDDAFLDLIERRAFDFFWYEVHPKTLFVVDSTTWKVRTSVAAIGMQLGAYIAGHYRKYRPREEIYQRVERLLDHCWDDPSNPSDLCLEHHEGWTYHWVDIETGKWMGEEHVCTHDSIMYLCGVIAAKHYFAGTRAGEIAAKILDGVTWNWIIHGGRNAKFVSNCYAKTYDPPCAGDVRFYDGMKFNFLLPIGGTANAVPAQYWHNYGLDFPWESYRGHFWRIERPAPWLHQWDSLWFSFQYMKDDYADYFQNSVEATLANRQWCIDHGSYHADLWGVGPCQGPPHGDGVFYGSYGAPPDDLPFQKGIDNDGTVSPTAVLPSILFAPAEVLRVARTMYDRFKDRFWRRYGFTDALNPSRGWFSREYLAIDEGPIVINIENHRSGLLHKAFAKEPTVWNGLRRAGFVGIVDNFDESEHSPRYAAWSVVRGTSLKLDRAQDGVREGQHALRIACGPADATNRCFGARPALKDFTPYRFLSFWVQSDPGLEPVLVLEGGAEVRLPEAAARLGSLGWRRRYFELPEEARSTPVEELRFEVARAGSSTCWLDAVFLTDEISTSEPGFVIDDLDADQPAWAADGSVRAVPESAPEAGGRAYRIEPTGPLGKGGWITVLVRPRFSNWSRMHSVALWARGRAAIRLRLKDGAGRSFDVDTQAVAAADGWKHLFYNIQANLNPSNCWEPRYDKRDIREVQLYIKPATAGGVVHLGRMTVTE